eukprot:2439329-Heterocapsa_arctica.AAC.1
MSYYCVLLSASYCPLGLMSPRQGYGWQGRHGLTRGHRTVEARTASRLLLATFGCIDLTELNKTSVSPRHQPYVALC